MKRLKNIFVLVLIVGVVSICLTGCKGSEEHPTADTTKEAATKEADTTKKEAEKKVDAAKKAVEKAVDEHPTEHPK